MRLERGAAVLGRFGILVALGLVLSAPALGQYVPGTFNYQGRLTDNAPTPSPISGVLPMEFRIYGSQAGSDLLWSESWTGIDVVDGIFAAELGSNGSPIPPGLFTGAPRYLEIVVSGEILAPRQRVVSAPYSHVADQLDGYEGVDLEESAEIGVKIRAHDSAPDAHAELIATHDHDSRYYTEGEVDALITWDDWEIAVNAQDELRFAYPDTAPDPITVMTLLPPASGGSVGVGTTTPNAKLDVNGSIRIGDGPGTAAGTLRYTGDDFEGRAGGAWKSLTAIYEVNVKSFGATGDGATDDTAAIQAALDSLSTSGGIVFFPAGRYLVAGQLVFPNDGNPDLVNQPAIVWRGAGALFHGIEGAPNGGTILDLRYAAGPKIATYGLGLFEVYGITFADFGNDDAPFIYTTNTTLHVHDCGFYGTLPDTAAQNDAIILGGLTGDHPTGGIDPDNPFQGYGTVIRENYFGQIRRAIYGRVFANAVVVVGNTVWKNCGTSLPDGAAIELHGDPNDITPEVNGGWYVAGNLIEVEDYPYGIKCAQSQRNAFVANNFYDPKPITQGYYLFEPTCKLNYVLAGYHDDTKTFVDDRETGNSKSTVVNFHQNEENYYPQRTRFEGTMYLEPRFSNQSPYGPRLLSSTGGELTYQLLNDSGMTLWYTPPGGSAVQLWQVRDYGSGNITHELKGSNGRIRNLNGSLAVQSGTGSALELGDASGQGIRVEDGNIVFSSSTAQILSGNGPPTQPAPDGSIYLRTGGNSGSTFYVREEGAWVAK
jgi:hypothetical protein